MPLLKKKHFFLIPLLFCTFALFSTKQDEPALLHGYIMVTAPDGSHAPAAQLSFHTIRQDSGDTLEIGPSCQYRSCTFFSQVDLENGVDAGLALLNPAETSAHVKIKLLDQTGRLVYEIPEFTVPGFHKTARLLSEWLSRVGATSFTGQVLLTTDQPLSVLGLEMTNGIIRNIPVIAPGESLHPDGSSTVFFPHFATGGGYRCSLLLWNPHRTALNCAVRFYDSKGEPADVSVTGMQFYTLQLVLQPGQSREIPLETIQR